MGAEVSWNEIEQDITVLLNGRRIELHIGVNEMLADNETIMLDTAPEIINNRTMVPIRAIAEASGYEINWDGENLEVIIVNE